MNREYHVEGKFWVSPYNYEKSVTETFDLPEKVEIHDATLRDGEQTPGVVMRPEEKVRLARKMDEIGIERIEAGMPAVSQDDFDAIKEITSKSMDSRIFTFARAMKGDIDSALECGASGVIIEVPIGYPKITYQFGWTWENVYEKSAPAIEYAREKGLYTVFFPYDTTRAVESDLENLLTKIMANTPPDSVGVVDTMGCALPQAIKYLVRKVKNLTGLPVEIHTHNDFGQAVACEFAAVEAGAEVVHSCINGLGERTGNASMEELATGLKLLYGYENPYKLDTMVELSEMAEEITGISLPRNKPIIGRANFTRESGIGVDLVVNKPLAMFAMDPSLVGREGNVVLGKKSGKLSILHSLQKLGIETPDEDAVADLLQKVKSLGIELKRLLTEEEFAQLVADAGLKAKA